MLTLQVPNISLKSEPVSCAKLRTPKWYKASSAEKLAFNEVLSQRLSILNKPDTIGVQRCTTSR